MFKRIQRLIEDPTRIRRAIQRRLPGVLNAGKRAVSKKISYRGLTFFKKEYTMNADSMDCFRREITARSIFSDKSWIIPIKEQGDYWFTLPYFPESARLDHAAKNMDEQTLEKVATQALSMLLDIHYAGYFHGDFHARNLYWYQNQLIAGDFEKLTAYPSNTRPPFPESFDLTGNSRGIPLPGNKSAPAMYYSYSSNTPANPSLKSILNVSLEQALMKLTNNLKEELKSVCLEFQSRKNRHSIRAQRIYSSFSLPYFSVSPDEAQRDSAKRLTKLGVNRKELNGSTLLDIGCNIGGMIFESQKFGPAYSLGLEFDGDKVAIANKIAAYNGLNNVSFIEADADTIAFDRLRGPYDVVFCFALIEHVQDRDRLYRFLGAMTKKSLFFEGNQKTSQAEVESKLKEHGFREVESLGICNDDCMSDNNDRPLYVARK